MAGSQGLSHAIAQQAHGVLSPNHDHRVYLVMGEQVAPVSICPGCLCHNRHEALGTGLSQQVTLHPLLAAMSYGQT